ncbi:MAG: DNA adenine methylase [Deltaproteobacteria bacterium]|nr:DNA adenine methylase [Deltaproteobacteria bacterium]
MKNKELNAKPFLKWAGGKRSLVSSIGQLIPEGIKKKDYTYIEPFVGGGAVLFWILNEYPNIKKAVINDINTDLVNAYLTIQNRVDELINILDKIEKEYWLLLKDTVLKKEYYYLKRDLFNKRTCNTVEQAALFIFLNRTCFNGLYRVNLKNEFNVPIGEYKKPLICDVQNLRSINRLFEKVIILNGDFEKTLNHSGKKTLFYFDPPYKPLSETSNFNSYDSTVFDDDSQRRLASFCEKIDMLGHNWILSNSDLKNEDLNDNFFDDLYCKFNIQRVLTRRNINSKSDKRGELKELLISNGAIIISE